MNVLSLFDGISCGQLALKRANIKVDKYYASEIDKYAIGITQYNFPDTIQLGDINDWKKWDINWSSINLLIGGSPCQSFSSAGKREGFNGSSGLFYKYVEILNYLKTINPNIKFLLENVKMKNEWRDIISKELGVQPTLINSSLLSAQNRPRYYWCNWNVKQPEDKNINLYEIIEDDGWVKVNKSKTLLRRYHGQQGSEEMVERRDKDNWTTYVFLNPNRQEYKQLEKKDLDFEKLYAVSIGNSNTFGMNINDKKSFCLRKSNCNGITYRGKIRIFTPIECERLQTIPDDYTKYMIDDKNKIIETKRNKRYESIGNGWTVDVISHILKELFYQNILNKKTEY